MPIPRTHQTHPPAANGQRGRHRQFQGVTLVELVVTIAVLGILMAIAAPSFARIIAANRISTQANEFTLGLNMARSEAVRTGKNVSLRTLNTSELTDYHTAGWQVIVDENGDGEPADVTTDVIRSSDPLAGNTTVTRVVTADGITYTTAPSSLATRGYITFNPRGGNKNGPSFFKICNASNLSVPGRIIQISTVGKVSLESSTEGCE